MTHHEAPVLPPWLDAMLREALPGLERFAATVGPYRMHVMTVGPEDAPPVLMLHGNPTWGFLWRKVAAALAGERLRIVLPDLIGLGWSDKPRDARVHSLENHARWVGDLVDQLGLERCVFVGQDWGGPIGTRMLADRPERAAGLVILNTVLAPPKPGFRPTAFHRFSQMPLVSTMAFRMGGFPQRAMHRVQGDPSSIRGEVARAYRVPLAGLAKNVAPLALARMVPDTLDHASVAGLARCQEFIGRFEGPAEIVWGDEDPVLGRLKKRVAASLPRAKVTSTDAGHFLQEEVPEVIAEAVRRVAREAFAAA